MSDPLPIEALFAAPLFSRAHVSPDGKSIAFLAPWRGRLNIFVRGTGAIDAGDDRRLTGDRRRNIESFCWTPDSTALLFLQDDAGDENWHLHRVGVSEDAPPPADLTPFAGARVMGFGFAADGALLLQMNARDPALIDLHRLDPASGALTTIAENPGRFVGWIPVPGGATYATILDAAHDHLLCRYEAGDFVPIARFSGHDLPMGLMPCVPTPDGTGLWVGSNEGSDRTRLVRIDLATGASADVDSHPVFDLDTPRPEADPRYPSSLIVNSVTGALYGARYLGERQVIHPLDRHFAAVLAALEKLSDLPLGPLSCDASGMRWTAEFSGDRDPGISWFYDHASGDAHVLGRRSVDLDPERLATVRPLTVRSRDGLALPCHLTLPRDAPAAPLPTVLLVHGGPWYRDAAGFDPEVQLLADRGYAVLQVNFRGSTGYGKAFMQAAKGEFAGRMHDDLIDALDWAIAAGVTDPDRVAIYGCSYGGYAALVGASFTPDRFAAAISYTGMSDLRSLVEGAVPFVREALANTYIAYMGDPAIPEQNADMLARSPVSRLDHIRCPVLVVHGARDSRVAPGQADVVVEALRARGGDVDYLVNETEGHWFINQDSNEELYRTIERFLGTRIGGRMRE